MRINELYFYYILLTLTCIVLLPSFYANLYVCSEGKKQAVLEEAASRLNIVFSENFKTIATILKDFDSYQYHKAYTSGLQEFIEALVFYQFLSCNTIDKWETINKSFQYENDEDKFSLLFPQTDFILGIADFTGELMRRCINNLGIGNISDCFKTCNLVKDIYTGFLGNL